jgi:predicted metal-dependent enzyme (double-stranded beta helix superfamily)
MTQAPFASAATSPWTTPKRDLLSRRPRSTPASLAAAIAAGTRGVHVPAQRAAIAEAVLRRALRESSWLPDSFLETNATHYRSRTLHVDRESGITIRVLAWRRGQRTPIHDHVAWCVIGVYAGAERELRYSAAEMQGGTRLLLADDHVMHAGQTAVLLPPDDIHDVSCLTHDAVSIHIYGSALEADAPSMRQAYEPAVVVNPASPAARASRA